MGWMRPFDSNALSFDHLHMCNGVEPNNVISRLEQDGKGHLQLLQGVDYFRELLAYRAGLRGNQNKI